MTTERHTKQAVPSETCKALRDAVTTGRGFLLDGKRAAPEDIYDLPDRSKPVCTVAGSGVHWLPGNGYLPHGTKLYTAPPTPDALAINDALRTDMKNRANWKPGDIFLCTLTDTTWEEGDKVEYVIRSSEQATWTEFKRLRDGETFPSICFERGDLEFYQRPALLKPTPDVSGLEQAAEFVERRAADYDRAHGFTDHDTGTREYPGEGADFMETLDCLASGIRALAAHKKEGK